MLDLVPDCDLSLIVPFADDEDIIGTNLSLIAEKLRRSGLRFDFASSASCFFFEAPCPLRHR